MAVETAKEVAADKTLRNKAEKERRLREKAQNNTKKFIEERKITAMKQGKEKEKLVAMHAKQLEDLNRDIQLVTFLCFSLNMKRAQGYACTRVWFQTFSFSKSISLFVYLMFCDYKVFSLFGWTVSLYDFKRFELCNLHDHLGVAFLLLALNNRQETQRYCFSSIVATVYFFFFHCLIYIFLTEYWNV